MAKDEETQTQPTEAPPSAAEQKPASGRQYIGDIAISRAAQEASDDNPLRTELRRELVRQFVLKKFRRNLEHHVEQISGKQEIAETMEYLFDEHGDPPANMDIEEMTRRRKELEGQIRWLEVLAAELRSRLSSVKEIEESALAALGQD
ncbi:MAG: hypothetical protein P8M78_10450 [Myxococcota bacterium]|nr:hypothetical protein [Myxococcota bacterium]